MKYKDIFSKVKDMSPMAKASFWFVISNIVLKGISFITTPIFTRVLEVADYGTSSVFVAWEGVISIFATLMLSGGVYNVAMTKYGDDIPRFTSSMIGLTAVFSIFTYTICLGINILFPQIFELDNIFIVFMGVQTFLNAVTTFWLMRKRFEFKYKSVIAYTMLNAVLSPTIALCAISIFPNNKAFAKIIGSGVPAIIVGIVLLVYILYKGKKLFHRGYWIYALKFNVPLLPHYFSSIVLSATDKLMINSMVGKAEAGIYGVAFSIIGIVNIVVQSINSSLIPYTLQSIKKQNFQGLRNTIAGCILLIATGCAMLVMFAREGILIFATSKYLDAVKFIMPLGFAAIAEFVSGIVGNIVFYYEKTGFMSKATTVSAVINVFLNFFGIKYFGFIAAGYTTAICGMIKLILYYVGAKKYEKNLAKIMDIKMIAIILFSYSILSVFGSLFINCFALRFGILVLMVSVMIVYRNKIAGLIRKIRTTGE